MRLDRGRKGASLGVQQSVRNDRSTVVFHELDTSTVDLDGKLVSKMIQIFCRVLLIFTFVQFSSSQEESSVRHHLQEKFEVVIHPKNVVAEREGNDVVMDCRDQGPLRAKVVWTSPEGSVLPTGADGRLILNRIRPHQAGRYVCSVSERKRKGTFVGNASKYVVVVVEPFDSGQCEDNHARCRSGECLAHKHFCNQHQDCADGSDEFNCIRSLKRSGPGRRPRFEYYPGDEYYGHPCPMSSWSPCNKNCKQYATCWEDRRMKGQYRYCQKPGVQCARFAVEPTWSSWSAWTSCSKTCGEAIQQRTRTCSDLTQPGRCKGLPAEQKPCENIPCPVDGGWSEWTEWTLCTELGYRTRERHCNSPPPLHGGRDCVGIYLEKQECHVCASTVYLKLSPGRVQCTLGRPTTFVCEYCADDPDKELKIDMDTEPSSSEGTPVHENMHAQTWSGPCLRRAWTLKLNNDHHRVSCTLKNSEGNTVGKVISTVKIRHEAIQQTYAECLKDQFTCKDKRCISNVHFCDGYKDCADGSDEQFCSYIDESIEYPAESREDCTFCPASNICIPQTLITERPGPDWNTACGRIVDGKSECQRGQFSCASRQCWTKSCQCDGVNDCGDWSDEVGCSYIGAPKRVPSLVLADIPDISHCYPEQIRCATTKRCILKTQVCDGIVNCEDSSDEGANCKSLNKSGSIESRFTTREAAEKRPTAAVCESHEFLCDEKKCLDWAVFRCDGVKDCDDGSDEASCAPKAAGANCTEMQFTCANQQCIPLYMFCDNKEDCVDSTDEVENCVKPKIKRECKKDEFKCSSVAVCIAKERRCDGKKDCPDFSDEENCLGDNLTTNEILGGAE